jgi:hypothetical protein
VAPTPKERPKKAPLLAAGRKSLQEGVFMLVNAIGIQNNHP